MVAGFRRRQGREFARSTLENFLSVVWLYIPPWRRRHFKPQIKALWEKEARNAPSGKGTTPAEWRAYIHAQLLDETYQKYEVNQERSDSFFRILLAVREQRPSPEVITGIQKDLRKLTDAMSELIGGFEHDDGIGFRPGGKSHFGGEGPWRPKRAARIRAAAELLRDYLNSIYKCGPVHAVCKGCGGLMTTAPGKPKKYCMRQCRWPSDDERRKYFRDMQRRRRAAIKHGAKPKRKKR